MYAFLIHIYIHSTAHIKGFNFKSTFIILSMNVHQISSDSNKDNIFLTNLK
ncbi:hypothetical protein LbFV_ORF41 [Leptopilina boulardi filamentous virus]|uniref:Uncharacterized protein n=1 Tax=Leptopilina boulardi filamentous virus TaxID=552509 RepID=A0A1S5YD01_9VIRU|nr:hypothetical protein LbFV_ORF41 [Leptopilina boulardi filamentous virus]AQQ79961.1 hypothetical protein LbFV_ORF41 [Leptopilina boulardi filamentous virus]